MASKEERELNMLEAMSKAGIAGPNVGGRPGAEPNGREQGIMEMQRNIKNSNQDLVNFVDDMDSWLKDANKKDKQKELRDPNKKVSRNDELG